MTVDEPFWPAAKNAVATEVMAGAWLTVSVNDWLAVPVLLVAPDPTMAGDWSAVRLKFWNAGGLVKLAATGGVSRRRNYNRVREDCNRAPHAERS